MIELKNITLCLEDGSEPLRDYSLIVPDGSVCQLPYAEGRHVTDLVLGFKQAAEGYVTIDGATVNAHSVAFMRKLVAYIPEPEGFEKVDDLSQKQLDMVEKALGRDVDIVLAVRPFSHQSEEKTAEIMTAFHEKASRGVCVVIANNE